MKSPYTRTLACLAAGWIAMFAAVAFFRPLMPVDETRYMSVAWEMLVRHNWILPTLNFEPYSHKPPLLFWLINASWAAFGVHVWPVRVVTFSITAAFVWLTGILAKRLMPERESVDIYAMLALAAMPMFLIYGSVIMFDTMLGVVVLGAMMTIWRMGQQAVPQWRSWALLGVFIGAGVLAKGPVALVYILPAILLAPLWRTGTTGKWYAGMAMAIGIGAAIALLWAIPAAINGGPEYTDKIFVTQSAGRMVNAFDHRRPFWFYILVLGAYLAPFLVWPSVWSGVKATLPDIKRDQAAKFIACWIVPVFVFFSAISSKQFHYMTPILPGFAVLVAMVFSRMTFSRVRSVAIPMFFMLAPSIVLIVLQVLKRPFMGHELPEWTEHFGYLHILVSAGILWWSQQKPGRVLHALSMAAFLLAVMMHLQLGQRFLPRYDLSPMNAAMAAYRERPIAVAPKYDGEYGYALRLTHSVDSIGREEIEQWLSAHPTGVVISRYDTGRVPENYEILYQQPFRNDEVLVIMERKVMVGSR